MDRTSRWTAAAAAVALAAAGCARHRVGQRALDDLAAGSMIELKGGTFVLAEPTGPTRSDVTYERMGRYLLDATEVTVAAYRRCVDAGACTPASTSVTGGLIGAGERRELSAACNAQREDRADHPVNCVDWDQATRYCAWLGKRLPSEGEWEWAARKGPAATPMPWGEEGAAAQPCWSGRGNDAGDARRPGTCPADAHPQDVTGTGVRGLAGNVREWTSTWQQLGADSRGRHGVPGRVVRGGAWSDDDPVLLSAWRRQGELPGVRDARIGFRCASDR
jgi:formylglycine-generating enzyme required for sulfatase activity